MKKTLFTCLLISSISIGYAHVQRITITSPSFTPAAAAIHLEDTIIFTAEAPQEIISFNTPYGARGFHVTITPDKPYIYVPDKVGSYSFKTVAKGTKPVQGKIDVQQIIVPEGIGGFYPRFYWRIDTIANVWHIMIKDTMTTNIELADPTGQKVVPFQKVKKPGMDISIAGWRRGVYDLTLSNKGEIFRMSLRIKCK